MCVSVLNLCDFVGGYNKENVVVNNVMRYERYLDKWIKVASMNTPRAKLGMATLDGYIYAIGGYDGTSNLCSVEKYCPQTNRWTYVSQLSQPVARIVATSLNGCLYAAGMCSENVSIFTRSNLYMPPRSKIGVHIVFVLSVILSLFHFVFLSFCHPPKT
jgi:N-acetylneuraminic acid mutarotase